MLIDKLLGSLFQVRDLSTYYAGFDEPMPGAVPGDSVETDKRRRAVTYYQWVPFVLLTLALLSVCPHVLWRCASRRAGLNVSSVVETARSFQKAMYAEPRDHALRYLVAQIDGYLRRQRLRRGPDDCCWRTKHTLATNCCLFWARFYGNHLLCIYVGIKILYLANAIAQIFLLDAFLGMRSEYYIYGLTVAASLLKSSALHGGLDWPLSERFPRVTLCDFQIRQQVNLHRYTVQCVLPINLFNEKIFLLIWYWLVFVAVATFVNLLHWTSKLSIMSLQTSYVRRQLRAVELERCDWRQVNRFVVDYLRRDGLLLVDQSSPSLHHP